MDIPSAVSWASAVSLVHTDYSLLNTLPLAPFAHPEGLG
jgi:hypothetical protein